VGDQIRNYMGAGRGALSPAKARELARSVVSGENKERITRLAQELVGRSNKNRERVIELVRTEVRKQLRKAGLVTREDLDALRKRVRDLEKGRAPARATKRSSRSARGAGGQSVSTSSSSSEPSPSPMAKAPTRRDAATSSDIGAPSPG
jgi:polyhydroxyalkanoate synthesis regulator phasin